MKTIKINENCSTATVAFYFFKKVNDKKFKRLKLDVRDLRSSAEGILPNEDAIPCIHTQLESFQETQHKHNLTSKERTSQKREDC